MADDYDAKMQKSLGQFRASQAQNKSMDYNVDLQQNPYPPPRYNTQIAQDTANRIKDGQTLGDNGNWQQPASPAANQVEATGQTLQQSGVTMQSEGLSPEKSAQMQSTLDNSAKGSGNEPVQDRSRSTLAREAATKDAQDMQSFEPSIDRDK